MEDVSSIHAVVFPQRISKTPDNIISIAVDTNPEASYGASRMDPRGTVRQNISLKDRTKRI